MGRERSLLIGFSVLLCQGGTKRDRVSGVHLASMSVAAYSGARVSRPACMADRRPRACYPDGDPSPNQAGLETRAPSAFPIGLL